MADFNQALKITLKHEGGYNFDRVDAGGETYKGISRSQNPKWLGWLSVDNHKAHPGFPASLDSDVALQENVSVFYRIHYWEPLVGDQLLHQDVANSIFDFGVNAGVRTSIRFAQNIVSSRPDGVVGPLTLSLLNTFSSESFLVYFTLAKINHYFSIIKVRPINNRFLYGWIGRALFFVPKSHFKTSNL